VILNEGFPLSVGGNVATRTVSLGFRLRCGWLVCRIRSFGNGFGFNLLQLASFSIPLKVQSFGSTES
jgi:hypothetical protein